MIIRLSRLHLFAIVVLALAATSAWAQDGRGNGRGQGQNQGRGQSEQGARGNRIERMRDAPRPKAMEAQPRRQEQRRPRRDDGLADSVRRIERSTRGRVLNAERVQSDGRSINRLKVMDDRGRNRVYMDDPPAPPGPAPPPPGS